MSTAVMVACGRSRVFGNLEREDVSHWYVRHEGAVFAKQYRKDEWALTQDAVCGRCDLPTDPGELIDLDHQPVCQPCAHHLVPELGELDHGRDA